MVKIPAHDVSVRVDKTSESRYAVVVTNNTSGLSTIVREFSDIIEAEDHKKTIVEYWNALTYIP